MIYIAIDRRTGGRKEQKENLKNVNGHNCSDMDI